VSAPAALILALAALGGLPAELPQGWQVTESAASDVRAAQALPADAWGSPEAPREGPVRWARLELSAPPALSSRPLALELHGAREGDALFAGGLPSRRVGSAARVLFELPPVAIAPGQPLVLLMRLTPRAPGEPLFEHSPVLDTLAGALERDVRRRLPQLVISVAVASFGLLAFLLFLRDRSRRALGLYAIFAAGIAGYTSAALVPWLWPSIPAQALRGAVDALAFLLPATGYLFLVRFLDLPLLPYRAGLLVLPAAGLGLSLWRPSTALLPAASGLTLFALGGELLVSLARHSRRQRSDAALLFVGTAVLLLSALFDAAAERSVLASGMRVPLLGPAFLVFTAFLLVALADEGRRLLLRATTDALTGIANRQEFLRRAEEEVRRAERTGSALAMVMLDLDHFKSINDRFGHPAGDRALIAAARAVAETIRGLDVVGRYGGEEFVVLLVNPAESSVMVAVERVRAAIAALAPPQVPVKVTVSAGVAIHNGLFESATVAGLIRRADAALYASKRAGRDRATLERPASPAARTVADVRYR